MTPAGHVATAFGSRRRRVKPGRAGCPDRAASIVWASMTGVGLTIGVIMIMAMACSRPPPQTELPMPLRAPGTAVMHAVHSEELRDVMRSLPRTTFERLPQELDDPRRQASAFEAAGIRARALADTADRIATVVDGLELTPDERQVFLTLAWRLRDRALELQARADRRQPQLIDATMKEIDATCTSCHQLFRPPQPAPTGLP